MSRVGPVIKVGGARAMVIALTGAAVALLVAAGPPARAIKPQFEMTKPHVLAVQLGLGARADGTLVVRRAHGALRLSPAIAPSSQRAWRVSEDEPPEIVGQRVNPVLIRELTIHFSPVREPARAEPDRDSPTATVVVVPEQRVCESGRGTPARAVITYDSGEGRGTTLTAAARLACHESDGPNDYTTTNVQEE